MWPGFTVCAAAVMWVASGCATVGTGDYVVEQDSYPTLEANPVDVDPESAPDETEVGTDANASDDREYVPADVDLGNPRDVTMLSLRVHVEGDYRLPSAPNHVVGTMPFEMQSLHIESGPGAEVTDDERLEALQIDDSVDADTPAIRDLARSIVEDAYDDRERVDLLVRYVYGRLTYTLGDETVASKVLASGEGDCTEYSLLFIAMARAAGIPARRVVGLAFTYENGEPAFGYHAWAEVELDGRWVQVDPTWNETVADATHVTLSVGDSTAWFQAVGKIEVWIVEHDRAPGAGAVDPGRVAAELPAHLQLRR